MYIPVSFQEQDRETLTQLIERYPFATVITPDDKQVFISHIPLVVRRRGERLVLAGHVARANAHWQAMVGGRASTAIFHGPHGYVSPTWYASDAAVPTWNYAVVHATGPVELLDGETDTLEIVRELTQRHEGTGERAWKAEILPADLRRNLLAAIVAFELRVERLEGKVKVSQNRSIADRDGVIAGLKDRGSEGALELATMMEAVLSRRS